MKPIAKLAQTSLLAPIVLGLALVSLPRKAHAWGDIGHQVVGEIAERLLTADPDSMNAIESIIGIEPLMIAAIFPDSVRSDDRFRDFAPYHFLTVYRDKNRENERDMTTVFSKYPAILLNPQAPAIEQAIALRYIIHLAGDAHQPLHVGNEFDFGANACTVTFVPTADSKPKQTNLHTAWDTDIINAMVAQWKKENPSIKYFGATDIAHILMQRYPELLEAPASVDYKEWLKESETLRKSGGVYPDQLPDDARPYCPSKRGTALDPKVIPVLGPEYVATARQIIEVQLVKGGARLAAFLKSILRNRKSPAFDESAILEDLLKKNDPKSESSHDD